jgi:hypothetical protein
MMLYYEPFRTSLTCFGGAVLTTWRKSHDHRSGASNSAERDACNESVKLRARLVRHRSGATPDWQGGARERSAPRFRSELCLGGDEMNYTKRRSIPVTAPRINRARGHIKYCLMVGAWNHSRTSPQQDTNQVTCQSNLHIHTCPQLFIPSSAARHLNRKSYLPPPAGGTMHFVAQANNGTGADQSSAKLQAPLLRARMPQGSLPSS